MAGAHEYSITKWVDWLPISAFSMPFKIAGGQVGRDGQHYDCVLLAKGNLDTAIQDGRPLPLRIHSPCITSEVFQSPTCDCGWQLREALRYMDRRESGLLIYLTWQEGMERGILARLMDIQIVYGLVPFSGALDTFHDLRDYQPALAILRHLGVKSVEVLTNNPNKIHVLLEGAFNVTARIPLVMDPDDSTLSAYLRMKAVTLGHFTCD
jgi:GTP cyclohydrolase II